MSEQSVTFVQLSDIHFTPKTGTSRDIDAPVRDEILADIERVLTQMQTTASAILVTGDIAFAGQSEEYEHAAAWLDQVTATASCQPSDVFCVPGNHDVDWSKSGKSADLAKDLLRTCPIGQIHQHLTGFLDENDGAVFLAPLQEYVTFATRYECGISAQYPSWQHRFELAPDVTLAIQGLTTVLVSDRTDDRNRLVMGDQQIAISRSPGTVVMTMAHHPPDWLRDNDAVEDTLRAKATIQLFGHKHVHRVEKRNEAVRIAAGAVQPERPNDWLPGWNALRISVKQTAGTSRQLHVEVWPRVWDSATQRFKADFDEGGGPVRTFDLTVAEIPQSVMATENPPDVEKSEESGVTPEVDSPQLPNNERVLAFDFLSLSLARQTNILAKLDLVDNADGALTIREMTKHAFGRALDRGLMDELRKLVPTHTVETKSKAGAEQKP